MLTAMNIWLARNLGARLRSYKRCDITPFGHAAITWNMPLLGCRATPREGRATLTNPTTPRPAHHPSQPTCTGTPPHMPHTRCETRTNASRAWCRPFLCTITAHSRWNQLSALPVLSTTEFVWRSRSRSMQHSQFHAHSNELWLADTHDVDKYGLESWICRTARAHQPEST